MKQEGLTIEQQMLALGLAESPAKKRKRHKKKFDCAKCGSPMYRPDNTNVMVCGNCGNIFLFKESI